MAFFLSSASTRSSPEQPGVVRQLRPLGQAQGLPLRGVQEGPPGGGSGARLEEREHDGDEHRRDGDGDFDGCHRDWKQKKTTNAS